MSEVRMLHHPIRLAKPLGQYGEHQILTLSHIVEWPVRMGRCWNCDFCGARFVVGDTMAMHDVYEDDGPDAQDRHWFSRIHAWHYDMESKDG